MYDLRIQKLLHEEEGGKSRKIAQRNHPTNPFTTLKLQNPSHEDPKLHKIDRSPDFGAQNCKRACRTRHRRKSHQIRKFLKFSTFLLLFPAAQEAKEKMHLDFIFFFFVISFFVFHLIFHRSSFIF